MSQIVSTSVSSVWSGVTGVSSYLWNCSPKEKFMLVTIPFLIAAAGAYIVIRLESYLSTEMRERIGIASFVSFFIGLFSLELYVRTVLPRLIADRILGR